MTKIINSASYTFSTLFGIGKFPFSATIGSLVGIIFILFLKNFNAGLIFIIILLISLTGIFASHVTEKISKKTDPKFIIIDEFIGALIAISFNQTTYLNLFLTLLLFRIIDIFKPFPINLIQKKVTGGWGIMLDDIVGGIITGVLVYLVNLFI